jgi:hypothetical protein
MPGTKKTPKTLSSTVVRLLKQAEGVAMQIPHASLEELKGGKRRRKASGGASKTKKRRRPKKH